MLFLMTEDLLDLYISDAMLCAFPDLFKSPPDVDYFVFCISL